MEVQQYLADHHVDFNTIYHRAYFQSQRLARELAAPGQIVAKAVLIDVDGQAVLAVLPATHYIDFDKVRRELGVRHVHLIPERRLAEFFPDSEIGAVPPFGIQAGVFTICDKRLAGKQQLVFKGNRHNEAIKLRFEDYERLERPYMADISVYLG
jgi:Ala-tRNA(Pro) deacylase